MERAGNNKQIWYWYIQALFHHLMKKKKKIGIFCRIYMCASSAIKCFTEMRAEKLLKS